ncbi:MAG: two-component regulator propeller domain-containing protein, partial [Thermonemataceae bacterium]
MNIKFTFWGALCITLSVLFDAQAQQQSEWAFYNDQYSYHNQKFKKSLALESNLIADFSISKDGKVIIAYADKAPLTIFDGEKFHPLESTIAGGTITNASAVLVDSKSQLWVASPKGLFKIQPSLEDLSFQKETTQSVKFDNKTTFPFHQVGELTEDVAGNIWINTLNAQKGGVARFNGTQWQHFVPAQADKYTNLLTHLTPDKDGNLWFILGEGDKGMGKFDGQKWTYLTEENRGLPSDKVQALAVNKKNVVYAAIDRAIYKLQNGLWKHVPVRGLYSAPLSIQFDAYGNLWIGTQEDGVLRLSPNGHVLEINQDNAPLPSNQVGKVYIDRKGYKWFLTGKLGASSTSMSEKAQENFKGLVKLKEVTYPIVGDVEVYNRFNSNFPEDFINGFEKKGNKHYVLTDQKGLFLLEENEVEVIYKADNQTDKIITREGFTNMAMTPQGDVCLGSLNYLKKYTNSTLEAIKTPAYLKKAYLVATDQTGNIWVSHNEGVARYSDEVWEVFNKKQGQLLSNQVTGLFCDNRNQMWIATAKGLSV